MEMRGREGLFKVGYQEAGRFGAWTLSDTRVDAPGGTTLDEFWLGQGQLSLWLLMGRRYWVWRRVTVLSQSPLAVHLEGSPEVRG